MYVQQSPHPAPLLVFTQSYLTDRTKRVKDARNEAQKEIEEYRKQKDEEFKKFEKEVHDALMIQCLHVHKRNWS